MERPNVKDFEAPTPGSTRKRFFRGEYIEAVEKYMDYLENRVRVLESREPAHEFLIGQEVVLPARFKHIDSSLKLDMPLSTFISAVGLKSNQEGDTFIYTLRHYHRGTNHLIKTVNEKSLKKLLNRKP